MNERSWFFLLLGHSGHFQTVLYLTHWLRGPEYCTGRQSAKLQTTVLCLPHWQRGPDYYTNRQSGSSKLSLVYPNWLMRGPDFDLEAMIIWLKGNLVNSSQSSVYPIDREALIIILTGNLVVQNCPLFTQLTDERPWFWLRGHDYLTKRQSGQLKPVLCLPHWLRRPGYFTGGNLVNSKLSSVHPIDWEALIILLAGNLKTWQIVYCPLFTSLTEWPWLFYWKVIWSIQNCQHIDWELSHDYFTGRKSDDLQTVLWLYPIDWEVLIILLTGNLASLKLLSVYPINWQVLIILLTSNLVINSTFSSVYSIDWELGPDYFTGRQSDELQTVRSVYPNWLMNLGNFKLSFDYPIDWEVLIILLNSNLVNFKLSSVNLFD